VTGVAAVATFMLKKIAPKYGLDANKDLTFLALPPGQRLAALQSGVVDAGLLSSEERFAALDQGMKEILYLGKEVKNSWGTIATNDQFIKAKPKLMHGFTRALLKALRLVKQNREVAMDAMIKFSELDRELAARTYDGMIGTFTTNGVVDEENIVPAGPKTINDVWNIMPYENYLVTAELTPDEIKTIMEEAYASHEDRNLMELNIATEGRGFDRRITSIKFADGRSLERDQKYAIAFNSFDSRSGGHRFMKLRSLLERPESNCTLHPVQTRDALVDYFRRHEVVHKIVGANQLGVAA
jgi:hypothetical protein